MSEPVKKPIKFDSEDVYAINVPNTIPQVILTDEPITEIPIPSDVKSETIEKDCEIVVPDILPKEELVDPDRVQITIPQDLPTQTLSERTMDELNPGPIKSTKIEEGEKTLNPDFKFLEEGKVSYQGEKPRFLKDFLSNDFKRNSDNTISIARNLLVDDGEYSFVLNTNDKTHSSNFVKIRVTAGVPTMIVTGRFESEDIQGTFKVVTENVVETLVGNLSGIVDELFGSLTGKGLYSVNSYIKGIFEIRDGSIFKSNLYGDTSIDTIIGQINGIDNGLVELNELYELTNQELLAMQQSLLAIDELRNLVFDQEGYFDAEKIKPLSIETTMLSVGAKPQRLYTSCLFQANYEGDKNKFYATDGTLTHFLYPEPLREWAITGTTLTLPDDSFRYIYARCLKNGNTGGILLSQAQLLLEDGDYYNFLIGVLSSVIGGTSRIATATFGQTTINGRFITTGRIQSADGLTYFDLDAGVIGGKITFVAGSSGYANLTDKPDLSVYSLQNDVNAIVSNLQAQIDGQVMTWFDTYIPTLSNAPATSWTNDLERDKHLGDLFYNKSTGLGYRFSKTESIYSWELLKDTDVALALANAAAAQDTADGKRRVFVDQPTTPYEIGDLWSQGTSGDIMKCKVERLTGSYNADDWEKAAKYTDDTAANNASYIARSAQYGKMLYRDPMFKIGFNGIYRYNNYGGYEPYLTRISAPADSPNAGGYVVEILREDLGNETDPGHGGFYWGTIARANAILVTRLVAKIPVGFRIKFASNAIGNNADHRWLTSQDGSGRYQEYIFYLKCGDSGTFSTTNFFYLDGPAQQHTWYLAFATVYDLTDTDISTIDSKSRHFITTPTTPYYIGDTYSNGVTLYRCKTQRLSGLYTASDWELATTFDNTKTVIEGGLITSGTMQVGSEADGGINVKAGITGQGSADDSVRLWAGATFLNRASAPWRVMQNGHMFSAGWEFDEERLYKRDGDVELELNSIMKRMAISDQGLEKVVFSGSDLPLLADLLSPASGTLYPGANDVKTTSGIYSYLAPNSLSLITSRITMTTKIWYNGQNFNLRCSAYLATTAGVKVSLLDYMNEQLAGDERDENPSKVWVISKNINVTAGNYKILYEYELDMEDGAGASFLLGGAASSNNTLAYNGAKNATIIGKNGISSYWANTKYLYLSQLATYFLEVLGNTKLMSGINGIDINSSSVELRGSTRSNRRKYISVSSTAIDIDFVADNIVVFFNTSGGDVILPNIVALGTNLGINIANGFSVRITILCETGSSDGQVWGRNSTHNRDTANYPYLYNSAGRITENYITMSGSDRLEFLLDYNGSNYRAYLLNRGT